VTGIVAAACSLGATAHAATLFLVDGGGWGHGVGLCQWGSEGYALHGWSYRAILAHYYPHTSLVIGPTTAVRVLLAEQKAHVAIRSHSPFLLVDAHGRKVHIPVGTVRFGTWLRIGGRALTPPVRVEPGAAVLSLGGRGYRGSLELLVAQGRLSVVNVVPLELYLQGVVGSEMPTRWVPAAYEAQAVASRSYALARMNPGAEFDLYPDARDQVYGGVRAERPQTNLAVGATARQVLTYGGRVITAYYSASSGGRTEAVENGVSGHAAVPYLVSVGDQYDSISPFHRWLAALAPERLARLLGFAVTDVRVDHDSTGRAVQVVLVGQHGSRVLSADDFSRELGLRSTRFSIRVLSLAPPAASARYGLPVALNGFLRGVGGVSLQARTANGSWQLAARVRTASDGRFIVRVVPRSTTEYRLAVDKKAGPAVELEVAPRITVKASGATLAGTVHPAVPVRIERAAGTGWRLVTSLPVGPSGYFTKTLKQGRYRVTTTAGTQLASASSAPLFVHPAQGTTVGKSTRPRACSVQTCVRRAALP
jgi:stage II sporulation protein D